MNSQFEGFKIRDSVVIVPHVEMDESELDKMVGLRCPNAVGEPGPPGCVLRETGGEKYDKRIE